MLMVGSIRIISHYIIVDANLDFNLASVIS